MKRLKVLATALLTAAACLGFLGAPPASAASIPTPDDDPFYAIPASISSYANGDVIDSRPINASMLGLPLPARAWQVKYRTTDSKMRPSATVTTVLVPLLPWLGEGQRPLVSYQTAEDGTTTRCAPSYALRAGLTAGFTGSNSETPLIASALLQGWAVTVPDYEGPKSEFLVAGTQAPGVLDGIRAARNFAPAEISKDAKIGIWGYSGGSLASLTAAKLQPTYAPELKLSAIAVGGLLADVRSTIDAFSGSLGGGAIPMGINGFLRAYPELDLLSYLSESGQAKVAASAGDCIFDAAPRYPFLKVSDIEAYPGALDSAPVAKMLADNSPLSMPGVPQAPVYHYHAILDEFAPIAPARAVMKQLCAAGVNVTVDEKLVGEHLTEIALGAPQAISYLSQRFAGRAAPNNC